MTADFPMLAVTADVGRVRLAARLWPSPAPRALLVISHGHGEHGGCYAELARELVPALGIDVLAFDYRGHGLSAGPRGVIGRYADLLDDLAAWLAWAGVERPGLPVFVLGHSNGGLTAIRLLETRTLPSPLAGLVLSNPSLALIADAPLWKRAVGRILLRVAPWVTFETGIGGDQLTTAAESMAVIANDPLRHHQISPPTYFGMTANGPRAIAEADRLATPTLLILGGGDPITAPAAGRRFFERVAAGDKELLVFEAMRHEPLQEVDRAAVIAAIVRWIGARIGTADAASP